jgi:hypothetical protein
MGLKSQNAKAMTAQQLLQQIRAEFPPERFVGSVTSGCTCDECMELAKRLRHQSWDTVGDDTMEAQFGSLPLLSQDALLAFLPAWLTRSLRDLGANEQKFPEWTLYSLALYYDAEKDDPSDLAAKTERLQRLYETLKRGQMLVVENWLNFIRRHAKVSDWDRESIDGALHLPRRMLDRTHSQEAPSDTTSSLD